MGIIRKICNKISNVDGLNKEVEDLEKEIRNRDIILKRIKVIATCNHFGTSVADRRFREENCLDFKTRKIFELASTFDKDDKIDFWQDLDDLEEDKITITDNEISIIGDE